MNELLAKTISAIATWTANTFPQAEPHEDVDVADYIADCFLRGAEFWVTGANFEVVIKDSLKYYQLDGDQAELYRRGVRAWGQGFDYCQAFAKRHGKTIDRLFEIYQNRPTRVIKAFVRAYSPEFATVQELQDWFQTVVLRSKAA